MANGMIKPQASFIIGPCGKKSGEEEKPALSTKLRLGSREERRGGAHQQKRDSKRGYIHPFPSCLDAISLSLSLLFPDSASPPSALFLIRTAAAGKEGRGGRGHAIYPA